jgi:16S rRNA processing protein RimM
VFLAVGRLRRSHGVSGEIAMEVLTDFPQRLLPGRAVYVGEDHREQRIKSVRWKDTLLLLAFEGIEIREQVAALTNQIVYIAASSLPDLPEGEYYHHQLVGLNAVDERGQRLGRLTDILETGANDVYVITAEDGKELLLPAIEAVILSVDLDAGEMLVRPPEWTE